MLVLSRRVGQKVLFPGLSISIEVMRSRGAVTRLGIDAPGEIEILREELLDRAEPQTESLDDADVEVERARKHELRNRLNQVTLKLQLLQRQLELGRAIDSEQQLLAAIGELNELENSTSDDVINEAPPHVLVVDDQPNECQLLATCLRMSGVQVTTASNGREAFDLLHEMEMPDLVLLDMQMPEVDGPAFLRMIREDIRLSALRVFAVSGSPRDDFPEGLMVEGWFAKPVRVDSLIEAMRANGPSNSDRSSALVLA